MKIYELLNFNRELLERLSSAGIKPDDYKYADLYADYERLDRKGEKKTYIVACLAEKYSISERQVYLVLGRMEKDLSYCKRCSVG